MDIEFNPSAALRAAGMMAFMFLGCVPASHSPSSERAQESRPEHSPPQAAPPTLPVERTAEGAVPPEEGRRVGILSPCVLHAGDSHSHRRERLGPSGAGGLMATSAECSFNAECVKQQGRRSPGDGSVELDCRDRDCSCSFTSGSSPRNSFKSTFRLATPCDTADMAEHLLRTRCLAGMTVEP